MVFILKFEPIQSSFFYTRSVPKVFFSLPSNISIKLWIKFHSLTPGPHRHQRIGGVKQNLRLRLIKRTRWPHKTWLIAQSSPKFEQMQSGHTIEKFWLRSEHGCDLHILTPAYNRIRSATSITTYYKSRVINRKVSIVIKISDTIESINSIV